ncbi:MAG TPA: hypothetical protein VGN72_19920 [Tepidisphaeraceae bacterium]|jgi:hypothetical protein|nr:hypothetical protein [Tepidisphaeraceae bacterium]
MSFSEAEETGPDDFSDSDIGTDDTSDLAAGQGTEHEFVIDNEHAANWFVRRIRELRDYVDRVECWSTTEVARSRRREAYLFERYGGQLENWLRRRLVDEGGRRRSINLPAGSVGLRATPAKLTVVDETALLQWVKQNMMDALQVQLGATGPDAKQLLEWHAAVGLEVRMFETVSKRLVNAHVGDTGEIPDGAVLEPARDQLHIR